MRQIISLNKGWAFSKDLNVWENVDLPHTWNAVDGQDGGNDYYRGTCHYARELENPQLAPGEELWLEFRGAAMRAEVCLNGTKLCSHDGGYSTFRVNLTEALTDGANKLSVSVDNSPNGTVYPQMADFTFYGGLYRDVNLIRVGASHFDLAYYGAPGIKITPVMDGDNARVSVETFVTGQKEGQVVKIILSDAEGNEVACSECSGNASFLIENAHKWHARRDPYLYTATAELIDGGVKLDEVSARFGCRSFSIDPQRGFILNGEEYPLRGVSRHQDRWGIGNALLPEHHREDMDLICEMGATTIRLAHYQHDQYFYDLCDERGLVIWAEIPYISQHMSGGRENTVSQMTELVAQNYNHPSIVVWGLSNEITMKGANDPDLIENHEILNDLCHKMDPTRLTTIAIVSMCPMDAKYIEIPDVVSWNHYFGWYGGETGMNGPWFDKFHEMHPNIPVGCSEYGCEALNWHTAKPRQGDYTEEYQAYYHEELIKQLFTRKYLWSTHVWNMFDFGADARNEGGENGQNHKGLVTFDRAYKKDSFYAYKAWLSDEPFVHICSKRFVDRVEDTVNITVYSNLPTVELFANGKSLGAKEAADHFFRFEVPNEGETELKAVAGECSDESFFRKVSEPNPDYILKEKNAILNWFDITEREGYLSLNSPISDIMSTFRGKLLLGSLATKIMPKKKKTTEKKDDEAPGFQLNGDIMKMLGSFTILRLTGMMGLATDMMDTDKPVITKELLLDLNKKLNRIKAPKK